MAVNSRGFLRCSRLEAERRRPRFAAGHRLDVGRRVSAVLGPIGGVDPLPQLLVIDRDEVGVLVDPAGPDVTLPVLLDAAVPGAGLAAPRADVQFVALADHPDRHRPAQCPVGPQWWCDLELLRGADTVELLVRPACHGSIITLIDSRSAIAR